MPDFNLYILFLVPHSSDQTQALDLGIFGSQKKISQKIKNKKGLTPFSQSLSKALQGLYEASSQRAITAAFESAGIQRTVMRNKNDLRFQIRLSLNRSKCRAIRGLETEDAIDDDLNEIFRIPLDDCAKQ